MTTDADLAVILADRARNIDIAKAEQERGYRHALLAALNSLRVFAELEGYRLRLNDDYVHDTETLTARVATVTEASQLLDAAHTARRRETTLGRLTA